MQDNHISLGINHHPEQSLKMLRTTLQTSGARTVTRLPTALRTTLRTQPLVPRTLTQRTFTTVRSKPPRPQRSGFFTFSSPPRSPPTLLQRLRSSLRPFHSSRARRNGKPVSPDPTPNLHSPKGTAEAEPQSLGAKMRKLSREYGWSALGVYFALTALDFPFCYLFVRQMGTDRIGESGLLPLLLLPALGRIWDEQAGLVKLLDFLAGNMSKCINLLDCSANATRGSN